MQRMSRFCLSRVLVVSCAVAAVAVSLAAKDFVKPVAHPAKTYPAHDDHTTDKVAIAAGLTYNLRVGTNPNGSDIASPSANPATGRRYLSGPGSIIGTQTFLDLSRLPGGLTYYWSVQAVDSAGAGSPFGAEGSF